MTTSSRIPYSTAFRQRHPVMTDDENASGRRRITKHNIDGTDKQFTFVYLIFSILASKFTKLAYKVNCSEKEMHLIINAINALQQYFI